MKTFKTTWRNIRRSPYQALVAIFIMTITFYYVSFFAFNFYASAKAISYFESRPQVTAFFENEVKQADIDNLKNELMATNKVASAKFVSKQDALKIYREQNKDDPLLLELVTADILPASLEISTVKIGNLSEINNMLKDSPLVSEVVFLKDIVFTLTSMTNTLRRTGIELIIVLSLVSISIMITIIGLKISQKKQDIEIMRLIGAGGWYIRWPFIIEGIFYGFMGSLLGWTIAAGRLWFTTTSLPAFLQGIPIFPIPLVFLLGLLGTEIIVAVVLGILSSFVAVLRYLK